MFNRSAIMKDAWDRYHEIRASYGAWQIKSGIVDGTFSACLKCAWRAAKKVAEAKKRERQMQTELCGPRGGELAGLLSALQGTQYLTFRYRAEVRRTELMERIDAILSVAA